MTGHGAGDAPLGSGTVRVELRAVNQRHLDVRVKATDDLLDAIALVEEAVRAQCVRGRIEVNLRRESGSEAAGLDLTRARSLYQALASLRDELTPGAPLPVEAVLRAPGIFGSSASAASDDLRSAVQAATERAIFDLNAMRAREGAALVRDFHERLELLRQHAAWMAERRPEVVEAYRLKFKKRIDKLLEGSDVSLDPARLAQEVALFADRSDIAEELTRLSSHLDQFTHLLGEHEAVGRKLDFLVQELGREVNTIGSKANDASYAHRVVEMKAELERVREQVQNVL